jgi:20S proteasome alpha/beta subunit
MTLIVALKCKDGIVFASDSLATVEVSITSGVKIPIKHTVTKIQPLGDDKLWAASGTDSVIQEFERYLGTLQSNSLSFSDKKAMSELREKWTAILESASRRQQQIRHIPAKLIPKEDLPSAEVLIVGYEGIVEDNYERPRIFHLDTDGELMYWENEYSHKAIGYEVLAETTLKQFEKIEYSKWQGCLIAYKTLADAINVSPKVGGDIVIWTIDKDGIYPLDANQIENLKRTYAWWGDMAEEFFKTKVLEKLNSFSKAP